MSVVPAGVARSGDVFDLLSEQIKGLCIDDAELDELERRRRIVRLG